MYCLGITFCQWSREALVYLHTSAVTSLLSAAFCRVIFTLLFFSSNTGLTGCREGDGIDVASRGISGSASTTPVIKMTTKREGTICCIQGDETNRLTVQWIIFRSARFLFAVSPAYLRSFVEGLSLSPCNFSMWYASLIFASPGRETVQLYSIVITLVFTLSETLSPRY